MKLRTRVFLQLAALCFLLATYGMAENNAYLYIVHGIPGRDIADNLNPGFPIDILVNGNDCLVRNLTFGNSDGPYTLAAGTYTLQISEANTLQPCSNPAVITGSVTLTAGENISAVAGLNATQPTLFTLADDLFSVIPGNGRFVLNNTVGLVTRVVRDVF